MGAGGFVGQNLCIKLLDLGFDVRGFSRGDIPKSLEPRDITWFCGDLFDKRKVETALAGVSIVVHLASTSKPGTSNLNKEKDVEENLIPAMRLVDMCIGAGVNKFIFLSSGGAIYGTESDSAIAENSETNPITSYGIVKLAIEKYLNIAYLESGLHSVSLRPSNPFGPYQTTKRNQGLIAAVIQKGLNGGVLEVWGDGSVVRDYLYVDDLVESIVLSIDYEGRPEPFNIGSGQGHSINEVVGIVEHTIGKKINVRHLGSRLGDVKANILDISKARQELMWEPKVSTIEGIRLAVNWNLTNSNNQGLNLKT
jgi:UDP-glucose 4-epimerase